MSDVYDPGSSGLTPALPAPLWNAVLARLEGRPFLRSEGMAASLAMPMQGARWLVDEAAGLAQRFDRYYRAIVDAEGRLADEPARRIGEPYEAIAMAEGDRAPLPLGRLDCVLDRAGRLRVIELNPVGVCTLHLRALSYLARLLLRMDETEKNPTLVGLAQAVDAYRALKIASIRRFIDDTLAKPVPRPTIGLLLLPGMHRGSKHIWAHELRQAGMDVIVGRPDEVRIRNAGAYVGETRVDALWVDWFFYLGYQKVRYEQTRFASKVGDFSSGDRVAAALVTTPGFAEALRDRAFTLVSPMRSYRALSKALLAWVDRPELALSADDRAYVREHLAETHDHHARESGRITPESARRRREELVMKPCRFGGSHGVVIGSESSPDAWARQLDEIWSDPEWVPQAFVEPDRDEQGGTLSYGVYDYQGTSGGILVRSAPETIVSARTAALVPVLSFGP